jgi:hypothetical protein
VGDYNGDGKSDIVWRSASNGIVTMGLMNGAAFVSTPRILNTGVWGQTPWVVLPSSITLPLATSLASGFSDPGFTRGAMRTEYDQGRGAGSSWLTLDYRSGGTEGCLWNAYDPVNPANFQFGCPGRAPLGSSDRPWYGPFSQTIACGLASPASPVRIGDSWLSCISYLQSNQYSANWTTNTDYWVISANSEPSFEQCNLGPPSLSWPVANYNSSSTDYFKAGSEPIQGTNRRRAHTIINAKSFPHRCQYDATKWINTIPFLSVGAQQGRGQSKPIAYITNPPYSRYHSVDNFSFDATMYSYEDFGCQSGSELPLICSQPNSGAHAGMYITAQWGGKNRQIFLDYFGAGSLTFPTSSGEESVYRRHFPWPVADSMFYPGAELVFFNPSTLQALCGITFPALPINKTTSVSSTTHYQFNASEVFACASRLNKFETPMPLNTDIPLVGVHWYVESTGTAGLLSVAVENMKTN